MYIISFVKSVHNYYYYACPVDMSPIFIDFWRENEQNKNCTNIKPLKDEEEKKIQGQIIKRHIKMMLEMMHIYMNSGLKDENSPLYW